MKTALLAPVEAPKLLAQITHETYELNPNAVAGVTLVKRFALADMCEREQVIRVVAGLGFEEGAVWLRANRHLYFAVVRQVANG
jgi:hypothetical protein